MTGFAIFAIVLMAIGIAAMAAGLFKASGQIELGRPSNAPQRLHRPKGYGFIAIGLGLLLVGYLIFTQSL